MELIFAIRLIKGSAILYMFCEDFTTLSTTSVAKDWLRREYPTQQLVVLSAKVFFLEILLV